MIRVSEGAAIDIFYGVPSSVPSTSAHLETTGGDIDASELETLMRRYPEVICLGEVMNYSRMIGDFPRIVLNKTKFKTLNMIDYIKKHYPLAAIEGHCPSVRNLDLAKLLYLGIDSDHCLQNLEGMRQRFANGMFVELQEKSVTPEIIAYLQKHEVDGRYSFVTDDVPPIFYWKKDIWITWCEKQCGKGSLWKKLLSLPVWHRQEGWDSMTEGSLLRENLPISFC